MGFNNNNNDNNNNKDIRGILKWLIYYNYIYKIRI